ncbi:MAG: lysophospholipid acyltransferase family protein [Candidatus Riflebacteria bacterium]|nr:lysophospholipid acyltransferase family protein [Candidatus Riflebacteria bacterium]
MKRPPLNLRQGYLRLWSRRAITMPGIFALAAAYVLVLPILLAVGAVVDAVRGGRSAVARAALLFGLYLVYEAAGVACLGFTWLFVRLTGYSWDREWWWTFRVELWYNQAIYHSLTRLFRIKTVVEGGEALEKGPLLLFTRHVTQADAFLPAVVSSGQHGLWLRYVLKQELQWVPTLDLLGHRLPNCFVHREATDSAGEIAAIKELLLELGDHEAVIIYPEGTRFTPAKRARIIEKLRSAGSHRLLAEATALEHVLPPRLGGPLGLIEASTDTDVAFFAHTGFEGINSVIDLADGSPLDSTVHVLVWRVPRARIPADRPGREEWLYAQWRRMDRWIAQHVSARQPFAGRPDSV